MTQTLEVTGVITESKKNRIVEKHIQLSNKKTRRVPVNADYSLGDHVKISARNIIRKVT